MTTATDTVWGMHPDKTLTIEMAARDIPLLVYDAINLEGVEMNLSEVGIVLLD